MLIKELFLSRGLYCTIFNKNALSGLFSCHDNTSTIDKSKMVNILPKVHPNMKKNNAMLQKTICFWPNPYLPAFQIYRQFHEQGGRKKTEQQC